MDTPCAVLVGLLSVLVWAVLAYSAMMSTLSFGAPSEQDLAQQAQDAAEIAWTATAILGCGSALAALLRLWRTLTVHLVLFGTGTAVLWAAALSR